MSKDLPQSIVCLFSIDNLHDQPPNNLIAWWHERPSLEELSVAMDVDLKKANEEKIVAVVQVWLSCDGKLGPKSGIRLYETAYWLQVVEVAKRVIDQ